MNNLCRSYTSTLIFLIHKNSTESTQEQPKGFPEATHVLLFCSNNGIANNGTGV